MNRDDIKLTLLQQVPVLVICSLVLDGGGVAATCIKALIVFWVSAVLSVVVLREQEKRWFHRFVRWGFFPVFVGAWFVFPPEPLRIPTRQRAGKGGAMKTIWRENRTDKSFGVMCDV